MTKITASGFIAGFVAGLCAIGCSARTSSEDSRTSWLALCTEDADCTGGSTCACGVCTVACSSNAECTMDERAVCRNDHATSASCSTSDETQKVCGLSCSPKMACPSHLTCMEGVCRVDGASPAPTAGDADVLIPNLADAQVTQSPGTSASTAVFAPPDAGEPPPVDPDAGMDAQLPPPECQGLSYDAGTCAQYCSPDSPNDVCVLDVPEVSDVAWFDGALWLATWGSTDSFDNHRGDGAINKWSLSAGLETVVGDQFGPIVVAGDATRLVWATDQSPDGLFGDIWTAALDGSNVDRALQERVIDDPRVQGNGLVLKGDQLMFSSEHWLNLLTLGSNHVEQPTGQVDAFTLGDAQDFFWADAGGIHRRSIDPEVDDEVLLADTWSGSLVADGETLYFASGEVHSVPIDGGRVLQMNSPYGVDVWSTAGGWVYWTGKGRVGRTRTDGSNEKESLGAIPNQVVTDFALGADAVYVIQHSKVLRLPIVGS